MQFTKENKYLSLWTMSICGEGSQGLRKRLLKVKPASPASASSRDEGNKKKIADVFYAHGKDASEGIQKVAKELFAQLNRSESEENRVFAPIVQRRLSTPCTLACDTLSRALDERKDSFPVLQRYLEDFFLAYFNLVLSVLELEQSVERDIPPDRTYSLWQESHRRFLNDLRELFAEEDFSTSRARMKESRRALSD